GKKESPQQITQVLLSLLPQT
ncbi:TPA: TetR/AcrR family transcriptional regulator, partial [Streptococcus agalactiae]|nr:TetR/AcrR family transcriptional regulator [Streptococcus agalactiae]